MTAREREVVLWTLEDLERIVSLAEPTPEDLQDARGHVRSLRRIVGEAHGAQSHAGRRRRKKPSDASPGSSASGAAGTSA